MWFKGREGVLNFSLHTADRAFPPPVIWRMRLKPSQDTSYCIITLFLSTALSRRCHDCTFAVSLLLLATFFTSCLSFFFFVCLFVLTPEPPQFIKEPEKHITAEMEKVVDIPCQARGELCVCVCVCVCVLTLWSPSSSWAFYFVALVTFFYSPWSWIGDCFSLQYTGVAPLWKQENHGWKWE